MPLNDDNYAGPYEDFQRIIIITVLEGYTAALVTSIENLITEVEKLPPLSFTTRAITLYDKANKGAHLGLEYWINDETAGDDAPSKISIHVERQGSLNIFTFKCLTDRNDAKIVDMLTLLIAEIQKTDVTSIEAVTFSNVVGEDVMNEVTLSVFCK